MKKLLAITFIVLFAATATTYNSTTPVPDPNKCYILYANGYLREVPCPEGRKGGVAVDAST